MKQGRAPHSRLVYCIAWDDRHVGLGASPPIRPRVCPGTETELAGEVLFHPGAHLGSALGTPPVKRAPFLLLPRRLSQRGDGRVLQVTPAVGPGRQVTPPGLRAHQARAEHACARRPPRPHRAPAPNAPTAACRAMEPAAVGAVLALPSARSGAFPP